MPYKDPNQQREFNRVWIAKRRIEWLLANGLCTKCGSWDDLNIDHIDPKLKISHKVWSWSKERREIELAKCQVLCNPCHKLKTFKDMGYGKHNASGYNRGCRCRICTDDVVAKNAAWRKRTGIR